MGFAVKGSASKNIMELLKKNLCSIVKGCIIYKEQKNLFDIVRPFEYNERVRGECSGTYDSKPSGRKMEYFAKKGSGIMCTKANRRCF